MSSVTGLSAKQTQQYLDEARKLIARYDRQNTGTIDEAEQPRYDGHTWNSFDTRINDSYVMRTTTFYDRYTAIKGDEFRLADANRDNRLNDQEMLDAYLAERDSNHDGKLSSWEKFKMSFAGLRGKYEKSWEVETDRQTQLVYDPRPVYNPPSPRPVPPSANDRPTPPSVNDRPTPPSVGDRPTPPSTGSRPTPPSVR